MMPIVDDLSLGLRSLFRNWRFSMASIACLTIAIAGVTSVFSIVNEVLLRPLPFADADRLVVLRTNNEHESRSDEDVSLPDLLDWQEQCQSMDLAGYYLYRFDLPHEHGFQRIHGFLVTDSFFEVLQAKPYLGISLDLIPKDGNTQQLMISTAVWKRRFEAKPEMVGDLIEVNSWRTWPEPGSRGYRVVGLLPEGMRCLPGRSLFGGQVDTNTPLDFCAPLDPVQWRSRFWRDLEIVGRLKPNVAIEQAQADIDLIASRIGNEFPDSNRHLKVDVIPLSHYAFGYIRPLIIGVFAGAMVVLAIAIGNVAHLMLVHFDRRESEFAIRAAMGAAPARLARTALIESLVLVLISTTCGVVLACFLVEALNQIAPREIPRLNPFAVDRVVVAFVALLAGVCLTVVAFNPIRRITTPNLNQLLNLAGRTASGSARSTRVLRLLVVGGLIGSYLLLVAAGLLLGRMRQLTQIDPGFATHNRLTMTVSLPQAKHLWNQNTLFCNEALRRIEQLPGVECAAAIQGLPMGNVEIESGIFVEGRPEVRRGETPPPFIRVVTDDYFRTMGIPLLHGRTFNETDAIGEVGSNRTVIVNQYLAQKCWPDSNPIGRRMKCGPHLPWLEVVGVVGDVRTQGTDRPATVDIYFPEKLFPQPHLSMVIHTSGDPLSMVTVVKKAIVKADPDAYVSNVKSMEQVVADSQAVRRYFFTLLATLSLIGMIMATVGVFLTTTFSVGQRDRELRIRAACGATPADILRLVLKRELLLASIGLGLGAILSAIVFFNLDLPWQEMRSFRTMATFIVPVCLGTAVLIASLVVATKVAFRSTIR